MLKPSKSPLHRYLRPSGFKPHYPACPALLSHRSRRKPRGTCGVTLPYVSRTRSSIAQYIKRDLDGRRTAGESQPGTVNKTEKTVCYLQKWCRLFENSAPSCFNSFLLIFGSKSRQAPCGLYTTRIMASSANSNPVVRINLSGLSAGGKNGVKLTEQPSTSCCLCIKLKSALTKHFTVAPNKPKDLTCSHSAILISF